MATPYEEFLARHILLGKVYDDLPPRIKAVVSPQDWKIRVKEQCIQKGLPWSDCLACTVCSEQEYYDDLMKAYRLWMRMYPYHLADYICRVQRMTPYKYYCELLTNMLKDEKSYDRMPNFTAADAVRVLGIGRNEYIAMLNQCKGRRLMWRMNPKGLARELLPTQPCRPLMQPWWLVSVVNIAEPEYRELAPEEVANLKTANLPEEMRVQDLEQEVLMGLYRRGLVYFDIPVSPDDRFSIPPLEGFVSNRTPTAGEAADPLEALLYSVFVASSESLKVSDLAQILNVSVGQVQVALSLAVRLGFATRLREDGLTGVAAVKRAATLGLPLIDLDEDGSSGTTTAAHTSTAALGDLLLSGDTSSGGGIGGALHSGAAAGAGSEAEGGRAVALLLDAEATSYLMMGALSPGLKRHSVTLFEGGRVAGDAVMAELMAELWQSYEQGQGFEGDMLKLTHFVGAMATALDALKDGSGGRPLELLRKESLAGLAPAAACKVLYHAYCAVVPAAPLPGAPLPLSPDQPGPAFYGPVGAAAGPWLQLAMYAEARCGPTSIVLLRGQRLSSLPRPLRSCSHLLLWPWRPTTGAGAAAAAGEGLWASAVSAAVAEGSPMVLTEASFALFIINEALLHTAVMVQPCDGRALAAAQARAELQEGEQQQAAAAAAAGTGAGGGKGSGQAEGPNGRMGVGLNLIDFGDEDEGLGQAGAAVRDEQGREGRGEGTTGGGAWPGTARGALLVDVPLPLPSDPPSGPGGSHFVQGVERHSSARGKAVTVLLPRGVREAVHALGLACCVGVLRLMLWPRPADSAAPAVPAEHLAAASVAAASRQLPSASSSAAAAATPGLGAGRVPAVLQQQQPQQQWQEPVVWVPLSVSLGLPLHCLPLCRLVCARALDAGFLTHDGRAAQVRGQACLHASLQHLIEEHVQPDGCWMPHGDGGGGGGAWGQQGGVGRSGKMAALRVPSAALSLSSPLTPSLLDGGYGAPWAAAAGEAQVTQAAAGVARPARSSHPSGGVGGATAGGSDWVQEPLHNLYFDGSALYRVDLSYCLQGGLGW